MATKKRTDYVGTIEKGIPLPIKTRRHKYPFADMKPGDSFSTQHIPLNRINAAISSHKKRHGGEYRTSADPKTGGIRVHKESD
jgi:hypothetical protein